MKYWFNMKIGQSEFLFLCRIFTDFVANIHFVHWCLLNCQFCIITFQCKMYFHFLRCFLPCILCWLRSVKTRNIILGKWCWWWSVDKYPWTWTIRQCDKTWTFHHHQISLKMILQSSTPDKIQDLHDHQTQNNVTYHYHWCMHLNQWKPHLLSLCNSYVSYLYSCM